jgi:hypothetical protein
VAHIICAWNRSFDCADTHNKQLFKQPHPAVSETASKDGSGVVENSGEQ